MDGKNEGVALNAPTLVAGGGVLVLAAAAIPLIVYAASKFKQKYYEYSDDEMRVINLIKNLYRKHCFPHEVKGPISTHFPGLAGETDANRDFPIYLQMDPNNEKQPLFFVKRIKTIMEAQEWNYYLQTSSELTEVRGGIKDMIAHICNYQSERNKGLVMITEKFGIGGKGYYYDPTNLFFEEFKRWLVELSKAPLNEQTLRVVEGRMNYLRKIDMSDVFAQSKRVITRRETVIILLDNLKNTIRPIIINTIAHQSSREHYKQLIQNITSLIRSSAELCFYLFRDSRDTPKNFILENMQLAKNNYEAIMRKTRTGMLMHELFNCPASQVQLNKDKEITDGDLRFAGPISELFSDSRKYEDVPWGMLEYFQNYQTLKMFYKLHTIIERLFVFQRIADDLYSFAGKGGDMLVYGYLAPQTQEAMHSYCLLLTDLEVTVRELHSLADRHRISIIERKGGCTSDEQRWIENFSQADNAFETLCYRWSRSEGNDNDFSVISESVQLVRKIQEKMDQVNTPEYKDQLLAQIEKFSRWMVIFSGKKVLPESQVSVVEENEKLTEQAGFIPEFLRSKNALQIKIDNDNLTFVFDKQDSRADGLMLLMGAPSREEFIGNLVDVCNKAPFNEIVGEEVRDVYKGKTLPAAVFLASSKKYNDLVKAQKLVEADNELRKVCDKDKDFLVTYLRQRYLGEKVGVPYVPRRRSLLNALSLLYGRECYVVQVREKGKLEVVERIENSQAKNPPVYLLCSPPSLSEGCDFPHFDRLIELRQQTLALARKSSGPAFFAASVARPEDKNVLLQQAEQAFLASKIKGIKPEEIKTSLDLAISRMDSLLELEPKNSRFHLLRAIYLANKGDRMNRTRSIADFDLAISCCPKDDVELRCEILTERGVTYSFLQDHQKSGEDYYAVLKLNPNSYRVRILRANLYLQVHGNYEFAITEFGYVIEHLKQGDLYLEALKGRLNAAMSIENYGLVVQDANDYLRLRPDDALVESKREQALLKMQENYGVSKAGK